MMKSNLKIAAVLIFVATSSASAQSTRPFDNSWFWGAKAGTMTFASNAGKAKSVGTVGGDWMITRTSGGLYVSLDMSRFTSHARVEDGNAGGGFRDVQVKDMKRFSVAALGFPLKLGHLRPYAGLGFSLDLIGSATPSDSSGTQSSPDQAFLDKVSDRQSQSGVLLMAGLQAEISRLAAFVQGTAIPSASRFLLNDQPLVFVEAGLRYNFGSSIERIR